MSDGVRASLDAVALRHNFARVRAQAPDARILAVVKSDAYGHGLPEVARLLASADGFAVARVGEGVRLRDAGIDSRIVALSGFHDSTDLRALVEHRLDAVIHTVEQLDLLRGLERPRVLDVWIKVDTGMHRIGFDPANLPSLVGQLRSLGSVGEIRVISHLANADDPRDDYSDRQAEAFSALVSAFAFEASLANSAGVMAWPRVREGWVRPGIMLYGVSPLLGQSAASLDLKPVMTLRSRLIAVRALAAGQPVGYGGTWRSPTPTRLGIVACGYGDGYPRNVPSGTSVLIAGRRVPLIGRVSMDMLAVDLGGHPDAGYGDEVVLWGEGLPVEEIAAAAGTIGYELLCRVAARVPREWHGW